MTEDESLIWASGFYMTEHLPVDFNKWDEDKLDLYMEDHRWEPFEYWEAKAIHEHIAGQASSIYSAMEAAMKINKEL